MYGAHCFRATIRTVREPRLKASSSFVAVLNDVLVQSSLALTILVFSGLPDLPCFSNSPPCSEPRPQFRHSSFRENVVVYIWKIISLIALNGHADGILQNHIMRKLINLNIIILNLGKCGCFCTSQVIFLPWLGAVLSFLWNKGENPPVDIVCYYESVRLGLYNRWNVRFCLVIDRLPTTLHKTTRKASHVPDFIRKGSEFLANGLSLLRSVFYSRENFK